MLLKHHDAEHTCDVPVSHTNACRPNMCCCEAAEGTCCLSCLQGSLEASKASKYGLVPTFSQASFDLRDSSSACCRAVFDCALTDSASLIAASSSLWSTACKRCKIASLVDGECAPPVSCSSLSWRQLWPPADTPLNAVDHDVQRALA
jgi:hypothetical protein